MDIKPIWECRQFDYGYQISAIAQVGEDVYRACQSLSFGMIDHAWHPELLVFDAIRMTNNSLYEMIEMSK